VSLDELPALSLSLLAEALQAAGAEERAIEVYRRGSELHPSDFGIWMRLAILLWRVDPRPQEEIVEVLRIAHALRPEVREVQHLCALTLHALWRYEDELRVMEDLVRAEPERHWYMHLLWPLKSLGMQARRIEAARGWLESIGPEPHDVSETTNATSALQHLAAGLEATGRYEEALAAFERGRDYVAAYVRAVEAGAMERNEFVFHHRPEFAEGVERITAILRDRPELERILRGERVPDEGAEYFRAACQQGSTVAYEVYDGADHGSVLGASRDDLLAFFAARVKGTKPRNDCS